MEKRLEGGRNRFFIVIEAVVLLFHRSWRLYEMADCENDRGREDSVRSSLTGTGVAEAEIVYSRRVLRDPGTQHAIPVFALWILMSAIETYRSI